MSTSVNITSVSGVQYTWATAAFAWDSSDGRKTWATATPITYSAALGETIATAEALGNKNTKAIADGVVVAERLVKNPQLGVAATLAVSEQLGKTVAKPVAEGVNVLEATGRQFQKLSFDGFSTADGRLFNIGLTARESIALSENYGEIALFYIRMSESLTLGEMLGNRSSKPIAESFATLDALIKLAQVAPHEGFATADTLAKSGKKAISESVTATDALSKKTLLPKSETLQLVDDIARSSSIGVSEVIHVLEIFGRAATFNLAVAEGFSTFDAIQKASSLNKAEAFTVFDEYRRRANGVISDMLLSTSDMTLTDFMRAVDNGHAPGYMPFRDFIAGDYEYQDAIFRAVLESVNSDRGRLSGLSVIVDVPDVFDRGSAAVTTAQAATGVRVNFTRTFHIVPEITLGMKGGTIIAIPNAIDADLLGFTLFLKDPATGNGVAGLATWAAHAY